MRSSDVDSCLSTTDFVKRDSGYQHLLATICCGDEASLTVFESFVGRLEQQPLLRVHGLANAIKIRTPIERAQYLPLPRSE